MSKQLDKPMLAQPLIDYPPVSVRIKYAEDDILMMNKLYKYMKDETAKSHLYHFLRQLGLKSPPEVYKTIILDSLHEGVIIRRNKK